MNLEFSKTPNFQDGYAVRSEDGANARKIITEIHAGINPEESRIVIGENECSYVATGGMVPQGADAVVMNENIRRDGW